MERIVGTANNDLFAGGKKRPLMGKASEKVD
jgi:hypothetical protein